MLYIYVCVSIIYYMILYYTFYIFYYTLYTIYIYICIYIYTRCSCVISIRCYRLYIGFKDTQTSELGRAFAHCFSMDVQVSSRVAAIPREPNTP